MTTTTMKIFECSLFGQGCQGRGVADGMFAIIGTTTPLCSVHAEQAKGKLVRLAVVLRHVEAAEVRKQEAVRKAAAELAAKKQAAILARRSMRIGGLHFAEPSKTAEPAKKALPDWRQQYAAITGR